MLEGLGDTFDPAQLHHVRIRFRSLRYTAELVDEVWGRDSGAPALFHRVQQDLGSLHDHFVLSQWLERKAARARSAGREDVALRALAERDHALDQAQARHREFLARGPRDLLAHAIAAMAAPPRPPISWLFAVSVAVVQ